MTAFAVTAAQCLPAVNATLILERERTFELHISNIIYYCFPELSNGQVLLVLTTHETSFSSTLDMNCRAERLKRLGIQVTADQWKNLIQGTVLQPDVKQYLFYNSRGFGITISVVLYVTLWTNLYSTLVIFSAGPSWEVSVVATVIALLVALAVRLIIYRHQHKWNTNTDMRLSAANEVFMKQDFLVGITDLPHKLRSDPQVSFLSETSAAFFSDKLQEVSLAIGWIPPTSSSQSSYEAARPEKS
ncbi:hypothetical protein JRQ81_008647 [Phrynocephalus forsythii]|uniref:Transmembrane protein 268 n=1 Tax=Phrynocephalus forsythii TaxID=171643 RepID=A0A9Q1ASW0_9SAUR|nr:hypothetical protein JRQ81_008647 [Phrynocephalus forsythii]